MDLNLPEEKKGGTIVAPSFVDFLRAIIARQKDELAKIERMDVKAIANGNNGNSP